MVGTGGGRAVRRTLMAAAVLNVAGMLLFTSAFTSDRLARIDPGAFSLPGTLLIMAWGLAYAGAARAEGSRTWLLAAFVLEKAVYASRWAWWVTSDARPSWGDLWSADPLAALYFGIYGPYDFLWGVVFLFLLATARASPATG